MSKVTLLIGLCIVGLILVLWVSRCDAPIGKESPRNQGVVLSLTQAFGALDNNTGEGLQGEIQSLQVDSNGNIYVLERNGLSGTQQLLKFSSDGVLQWVVNEKGDGPGEIDAALGFILVGDSVLYLANRLGTRYDKFSLAGNYESSMHFNKEQQGTFFSVAGMLASDKLIVFHGLNGRFGVKIGVIDLRDDWYMVDSLTLVQESKHELLTGISFPPAISIVDGRIILSHLDNYRYSFYTLDGEEVRTIERPDVRIEPPHTRKSGPHTMGRQFSFMFPLLRIDDFYIGGGYWPGVDVDPDSFIQDAYAGKKVGLAMVYRLDIFDEKTGELIASLDARDYGIKRVVASDSRNQIYAVLSGDEPLIGRFTLDIEPAEAPQP